MIYEKWTEDQCRLHVERWIWRLIKKYTNLAEHPLDGPRRSSLKLAVKGSRQRLVTAYKWVQS